MTGRTVYATALCAAFAAFALAGGIHASERAAQTLRLEHRMPEFYHMARYEARALIAQIER